MNTIDQQIADQIEGRIVVNVFFEDLYNNSEPEPLELYSQDGNFWIRPIFSKPKIISESLYYELKGQFTNGQEFNTDPEVIYTDLRYDDFFNRYYNDLDSNGNARGQQ